MPDRLQSLFADRPVWSGVESILVTADASQRAIIAPQSRLKIERRIMESGESGGSHAWKPSYVSDTEITITGGSLRYGIETFTVTDNSVAVTADVLNYVYLKITCSTVFNAGYLSSAEITEMEFEASTTAKTDTETAKYVLLFEWEDNTKKQQHLYWSLGASFYTHAEDVSGLRTWATG